MHRTCVSEGGGDVQLLQRLDQIPQKTENIFLAASHGADSPLHFEIEFGISLLELFAILFAIQQVVWHCPEHASVSQPTRLIQL